MKPAAIVPRRIAQLMSDSDRKACGVTTFDEDQQWREVRFEKEIQRECERWLTGHGYLPRTPDGIGAEGEMRGWFLHLHETRANPMMLDLLILRLDGAWLECELKTASGALRDNQAAILKRGGPVRLCRSVAEFIAAVAAWEAA